MPIIEPVKSDSDSEEERKQDLREGKAAAELSGPTRDDLLEKSYVILQHGVAGHVSSSKDAIDAIVLRQCFDTVMRHVEHSPWKVRRVLLAKLDY